MIYFLAQLVSGFFLSICFPSDLASCVHLSGFSQLVLSPSLSPVFSPNLSPILFPSCSFISQLIFLPNLVCLRLCLLVCCPCYLGVGLGCCVPLVSHLVLQLDWTAVSISLCLSRCGRPLGPPFGVCCPICFWSCLLSFLLAGLGCCCRLVCELVSGFIIYIVFILPPNLFGMLFWFYISDFVSNLVFHWPGTIWPPLSSYLPIYLPFYLPVDLGYFIGLLRFISQIIFNLIFYLFSIDILKGNGRKKRNLIYNLCIFLATILLKLSNIFFMLLY